MRTSPLGCCLSATKSRAPKLHHRRMEVSTVLARSLEALRPTSTPGYCCTDCGSNWRLTAKRKSKQQPRGVEGAVCGVGAAVCGIGAAVCGRSRRLRSRSRRLRSRGRRLRSRCRRRRAGGVGAACLRSPSAESKPSSRSSRLRSPAAAGGVGAAAGLADVPCGVGAAVHA